MLQWTEKDLMRSRYMSLQIGLIISAQTFAKSLNEMLAKGFPIDYVPENEPYLTETLLEIAIRNKLNKHAEILIDAGADVSRKNVRRRNALINAATSYNDNIDLNTKIISRIKNINETDDQYLTALSHWCTNQVIKSMDMSNYNFLPVIRLLIENGADPDAGIDWIGNFLTSTSEGIRRRQEAEKLKKYIQRYKVLCEELHNNAQNNAQTFDYEL